MKTFTRILAAIVATAFVATGCVSEDPAYKNKTKDPDPSKTGFLAVGDIAMRVIVDTDTQNGDTSKESENAGKTSQAAKTRADIDTNDFIVEIFDKNGTSAYKTTYGEMSQATEPVELAVGTYTMEVRSEDEMPAVAWEHPSYGCKHEFSILKAKTTTIEEMVCTLQNIKVTLLCSIDLADQLIDATTASVSLGSTTETFAKGDTRALYFKPTAENNTLEFLLSGEFEGVDGAANKPVQFSKTIENVKAGQWRKITLVITWADKGDIKFDITVSDFIEDEEVILNQSVFMMEALYDESKEIDPSAPTITWVDHDINKVFQLKKEMFDGDGNCTEPFQFDLQSPNGIESMVITISSTNADFITSLEEMMPTTFDLCLLTPADGLVYNVLKGFGFPIGSELQGKNSKSFDIANQMSMLYLFDGTHTFTFNMTDANGLSAEAALMVLVDKEAETNAPSIVWRGYDIDKSHVLTDDMQIDIDITSPTGITAFRVNIISETLTDDLLGVIHLPRSFDLCDVTDPDMLKTVTDPVPDGLGFPANNDVTGKTQLLFSISAFVPMLQGLDPAQHDFELTITNESGATTTKTVSLIKK